MLAFVSHPSYSYPFPDKHRFPMAKFSLLLDYLRQQGIVSAQNLVRPGRARDELLGLAHHSDYIQQFTAGTLDAKSLRRIGLPWTEPLAFRSRISPAGTYLTAQLALKYGLACHLAGGTHHAHYDFGSGFCIFNDLAITAKALIQSGRVQRVAIFDCDVHQGDGTATILADEPNVFTCSLHCEKNFPVRKAISDLDVNLPKGMQDAEYLKAVADALAQCLSFKPDIVIYDAGVDVYQHDPLGLLDISLDGIRQRDHFVLSTLVELGIPTATVIGGGYDKDQQQLAIRHAIIAEEANRCFQNVG